MRILFITTGLGTGGAEMMLLKVLTHLDRQRFEPLVISLTGPGALAPAIEALGIPVQAINLRGKFSDIPTFFRLIRLIKAFQPDVVHTWMYHADLLGGLAARLAGAKTIAWCLRNSDLDATKTKFSVRFIVKLCAWLSHSLPTRILSCSEQARLIHEAIGYAPEKMAVIPNGFDLSRFKPDYEARVRLRKELDLADDALLVGLIGRYDPQKNHLGFCQAAGLLHQQLPNVHFILAGNGVDDHNTSLVQAATAAGIIDSSHFLGLRQDIPEIMAALDVLASASTYGEAFPNVLGEAMACGVPCVVTDVGDSAYIVADTGRVVNPDDNPALAANLAALLTLPAEQRQALGNQARQRVAAYFDIIQVVQAYEQFYRQLLKAS
ncbi:MAG: glycosyltransferase [Methylococcales bacterium]|nr:glycosyltransferase [Methylococcales bacterium]